MDGTVLITLDLRDSDRSVIFKKDIRIPLSGIEDRRRLSSVLRQAADALSFDVSEQQKFGPPNFGTTETSLAFLQPTTELPPVVSEQSVEGMSVLSAQEFSLGWKTMDALISAYPSEAACCGLGSYGGELALVVYADARRCQEKLPRTFDGIQVVLVDRQTK
ncbi:MAG: hypothetical protein ACYCOU_04295 [Sulfobacillus sp.]